MNKQATHMEGIEYISKYLLDCGIDTVLCKENRKTYLKIVGGKYNNKVIGVGALQEHNNYLMSITTGDLKYDYIIIVTGLKYTIKRVYIMTDNEARTLARDAISGDENNGNVTAAQLSPYRENYNILINKCT